MKSVLQTVAANMWVTEFENEIEYLRELYRRIKKIESNYTLQKFTQELGLGENNSMTLYLNRKRFISIKNAQKIIASISLQTRTDEQAFILMCKINNPKYINEREGIRKELLKLKYASRRNNNSDSSELFFKNWYTAAIFEAVSLFENGATAEQTYHLLDPSPPLSEVSSTLDYLTRIGLLRQELRSGAKAYVRASNHFSLGDRVDQDLITNFHVEMMNLAKRSIEFHSEHEREFQSVTLAVAQEDIKQFKEEIIRFRDYLITKANIGRKADRIVQVNLQLFPLTHGGSND